MLKLISGLLEYFVLIQVLVMGPAILMSEKFKKPILLYMILALAIVIVSSISLSIKLHVLRPIKIEGLGLTVFFLFSIGVVSFFLKLIFKQLPVIQGHVGNPLYVAVLFVLFLGSQLITSYLSDDIIDVLVNSVGIAIIFFFTSIMISIAIKAVSNIYLPTAFRGYPIALIIAGLFVFVSGMLADAISGLWREL